MKRKSGIVWVLVVLMALLTSCGKAEEPAASPEPVTEEISAWDYDMKTHTLYINTDAAMDAYLPDKENEEGTTTNAPWAEYLQKIENIVVGDDVSYIGDYAFAFCGSLRTVIVGKGVGELGWRCIYRSSDWENHSDLVLIFNCAQVPSSGIDVFGYTWDNPNALVYVPDDLQEGWKGIVGDRPMRIANMNGNSESSGQNETGACGDSGWSVRIGDFDAMCDGLEQNVMESTPVADGSQFEGFRLSAMIEFANQDPSKTVWVHFAGSGVSAQEVTNTQDTFIVYKRDGNHMGGPYLIYEGRLFDEVPVIEVKFE